MRTVAEAYGPIPEDSDQSLETDIPASFAMIGDWELLIQLFSSPIENALRYTSKGTNVAMRLSCAGFLACAEISDNGPGIPEAGRSRVLQRFYRLEHSRTTLGDGLRLSLVSAIIDVHGATMKLLDNRPGAKIVIHFPGLNSTGAITLPRYMAARMVFA